METKQREIKQRLIKFRAYVEFGDNSEINGMIENVTIYPGGHDGDLGCDIESFNEGIKDSGWQFDGDNGFYPIDKSLESFIEADEFNVRCLEDWVWFDGDKMQFTGLLDKNGKEIYEGDIVKCHDHPTGIEDMIGEVVFGHGRYWVGTGSIMSLDDYGTAWTEVLGNVYSTPDLIK